MRSFKKEENSEGKLEIVPLDKQEISGRVQSLYKDFEARDTMANKFGNS